jgi:hypothetical protein
MTFERKITILGPGDNKRAAMLACDIRDWTEGGLRHTESIIRLLSEGFDIASAASDFFEAFCGIREQLAAQDFYPLCYGASRNVYPSGMCRDMAAGEKAYKMQIGKPVGLEDLVEIFETGPDVEVSTVAAQKAFWHEWLRSNRKYPGQ